MLAAFANPGRAAPLTMAQDTFLTFEAACLDEVNNPEKLRDRAISMNAVQLDPALSAKLLAGLQGTAYRLKTEVQPLYILLTSDGTCTVVSRDANGLDTEAAFLKYIRHNTLEPESVGSEMYDYFAISYNVDPSLKGHALVIVHYSKMLPGAQIAMTPERNLIARGISLPDWP